MPRKPMPWFRFYTESFGDRKIRRLTHAQRWAWAAILGAARESPEPGVLYVAEGLPMTVKELAYYADVRSQDARRAVELCVSMRMVTVDQDGLIRVTNWRKRQPESDDVTARTRAHRGRSKEQVGNVPTGGANGGDLTATRSQERGSNGPETLSGTDGNRSHLTRSSDTENPENAGTQSGKERSNNVPGNGLGTNAFRASARGTEIDTDTDNGLTQGGTSPNATREPTTATPPPTCSRHPDGNPRDQPCAGCARVREWHEHQDERADTDRRDRIERVHTEAVLADLDQARRNATQPPANWRNQPTQETA